MYVDNTPYLSLGTEIVCGSGAYISLYMFGNQPIFSLVELQQRWQYGLWCLGGVHRDCDFADAFKSICHAFGSRNAAWILAAWIAIQGLTLNHLNGPERVTYMILDGEQRAILRFSILPSKVHDYPNPTKTCFEQRNPKLCFFKDIHRCLEPTVQDPSACSSMATSCTAMIYSEDSH